MRDLATTIPLVYKGFENAVRSLLVIRHKIIHEPDPDAVPQWLRMTIRLGGISWRSHLANSNKGSSCKGSGSGGNSIRSPSRGDSRSGSAIFTARAGRPVHPGEQ